VQQLESWPTDSLIEYARNARKNDHAVDRVAAAIREFGFRVPILAKSDKTIVDGHLTAESSEEARTGRSACTFVRRYDRHSGESLSSKREQGGRVRRLGRRNAKGRA